MSLLQIQIKYPLQKYECYVFDDESLLLYKVDMQITDEYVSCEVKCWLTTGSFLDFRVMIDSLAIPIVTQNPDTELRFFCFDPISIVSLINGNQYYHDPTRV